MSALPTSTRRGTTPLIGIRKSTTFSTSRVPAHPETVEGPIEDANLTEEELIAAKAKNDPLFNVYGPPFVSNGSNIVLNERAIAAKCVKIHTVQFNATKKVFERYDPKQGLWVLAHDSELARSIDRLLLELGQQFNQMKLVRRLTASKLNSIAKMIRAFKPLPIESCLDGLVHASNGIIDLRGKEAELLKHDTKYPFDTGSGIHYDPKARCPRFLKELLGPALERDDIGLAQQYLGSTLLGKNLCHGILVFVGTAGGGKSTLLTVIERVLGEPKVAHLRTGLLGGRFETSAFLGKRLLVGKDVPGDTLAVAGAKALKSLVGDDLMQAEIKYNPDKQKMRGDFHVVIVSNSNLRIALDGDHDAWRRRLLVIGFDNPKPTKPIPNFAEALVAEEGSGILNWMIEGALNYRAQMQKLGHLRLNQVQLDRIETLLQDSDNVVEFVKRHVKPDQGSDVTSDELHKEYLEVCVQAAWTPVASQKFLTLLPDVLGAKFQVVRRNDIVRNGKSVRGYKNIRLA